MTELSTESPTLIKFREIRKPLPQEASDILPTPIPMVVSDERDGQTYFDIAQNAWRTLFDRDQFLQSMSLLASSPHAPFTQQESILQEVIVLRKFGLMYKSAWILFDVQHKAPTDLNRFLKLLGKLKDYYQTERRQDFALILKNLLEEQQPTSDDSFKPSSIAGINENLSNVCRNISEHINRNNLPDREFHALRKKGIRHIMNLYQLAAVAKNKPSVVQTFQYLKHIDSLLGQKHDDVIRTRLQAGQHQEKIISVEEAVRGKISDFITAFLSAQNGDDKEPISL